MAKSHTTDWVSLATASARAGISESTLRSWIAAGKVESSTKKNGSVEQPMVKLAQVLAQTKPATGPAASAEGKSKTPRAASSRKAPPARTDRRSNEDLFGAALERLAREAERAGRFEAEIEELRGALARSMTELDAKAQLEGELEKTRTQVHDLEAKAASLSEELGRLDLDISEKALLEWSRAEATAKARSAEQRLEEVTLDLREARAAALLRDRAESEAAERLVRVNALEDELDSTRTELAQMGDHVRDLEGEINRTRTELEKARVAAQRFETKAEKKQLEGQETIAELTAQAAVDRDLIGSLRAKLQEKEQAHIEAVALTASLRQELEIARTTALRIPELETELMDARGFVDRKQRRQKMTRAAVTGFALLLLACGFVARGVGAMNYELHGGSTSISATDEEANASVEHRGGRTESFSGGYTEARAWLDERIEALRAEDPDAADARLALTIGGWLASTGAALLALRLLLAIAGRFAAARMLMRRYGAKMLGKTSDAPLSQAG